MEGEGGLDWGRGWEGERQEAAGSTAMAEASRAEAGWRAGGGLAGWARARAAATWQEVARARQLEGKLSQRS